MHKPVAVISLSLLSSAVLSSCGFVAVENRDKLARAVLTHPDGGANDTALQAALNAKYPNGTPARELKDFSSSFGGSCGEPKEGVMHCKVPTYTAFCVSFYVRLTVNLNPDSSVRGIEVKNGDSTC